MILISLTIRCDCGDLILIYEWRERVLCPRCGKEKDIKEILKKKGGKK